MRFGLWRLRRLRYRVARSLWVIPGIYAAVAISGSVLLMSIDTDTPLDLPINLSAASSSTALAALGSGMITFTGFVMSVVLLIVQFGSTQFSPRFLRWFRTDPVIKHSLGTFIATFVFALVATVLSGSGPEDSVPYRALFGALLLMTASIAWFLALISRTSDNLRVAHVTQRIDRQARQVFDNVYPATRDEVAAAESGRAAVAPRTPVQELRNHGVGGVLVAVDRHELLRLAVRFEAVIELRSAVGDHIAADGTLIRIHGDRQLPARSVLGALTFGDERTIEDDPAFALRLLVDVAIKALSPAVNDPTTAVQSLHRIEDLLRYAGDKHLSTGVVTDKHGQARLLIPTPTWEDLVELALDEIRAFGSGHYQISRRVRAMLADLTADLPDQRHAALKRQAALLEDAVERAIPLEQRADALIADRQGLGLGRGAAQRSSEVPPPLR